MLFRHAFSLALAFAGLVLLWGWLFVTGTVLVVDEAGTVARVELVGWRGARPLRRLPGGYFVGLPHGDGTVRLTCRDGSRRELGYVSGAIHIWVRVEPGAKGACPRGGAGPSPVSASSRSAPGSRGLVRAAGRGHMGRARGLGAWSLLGFVGVSPPPAAPSVKH